MPTFFRFVAAALAFGAASSVPALAAGENDPSTSPESPEAPPKTSLRYADAAILGVVEGISEYLPISSTGHLIVANEALRLNTDTPARDAAGEPIFVEEDGERREYTMEEAIYAYTIVIQGGAIAAVLLLYWRRVLSVALGVFGRDVAGRKLAVNLAAAFLPAAVLGLLLDDWIESVLGDNVVAVAGALIVGAFVMLAVERWRRRKLGGATPGPEAGPDLHEIPARHALAIGVCQCFAMWPGTSRSMATIVGGYLVGFSPPRAAEFSFLLGLITLTAASGYKFVFDGGPMLRALDLGPVLLGAFVACVAAALSIRWLVGYLGRHGLGLFAWYRIALGFVVLAFVA